MKKDEVTIRYSRGRGNGGQRRDKVFTCVIMTHKKTGLQVRVDGRNREQNKRQAYKQLQAKVDQLVFEAKAKARKQKRDEAIKDESRIRTYDITKGVVTDHRSGKKASTKDILEKGKLDLLR